MKRLENKTVFITGGLSGIGKACAVAAAIEGANIVIADIRSDDTDNSIAEIKKENPLHQLFCTLYCLSKHASWMLLLLLHNHNLFLHVRILCFVYIFSTNLFCSLNDLPNDHLVGNIQ